jgi:hypothetical protein
METLKPSTTIDHCIAWDGNVQVVGLVQDDGGVRVDYHGDLEALSFWSVAWDDPKNPWKGGRITGPWPTKLIPRYS